MASIQDSMIVARSAMLAHQERLAVISHNIANINTEGYHRQIATLSTNPAVMPTMYETKTYEIGSGVTVSDVIRTYNHNKENLLNQQASDSEAHMTKSYALGELEALLIGTGDASISKQLQDFWNAWQDTANHADNIAFRSVLMERGVSLSTHLNTLHTRLTDYRAGIASGAAAPFSGIVPDEVADVNLIASEIQTINARITSVKYSYTPLDLMDRRTQLIRELSEKSNISVTSDYEITIDGKLLVSADGTTRNDLIITSTATPITFSIGGSPDFGITDGTLGAWSDVVLEGDAITTKLNNLATTIITEVNNIHDSTLGNAYDLYGNISNIGFFSGTDASDISVHASIHDATNPLNDDPRLIAAGDTNSSGNGAKALQIADLIYNTTHAIADIDGQSFSSYFTTAVSALGAKVKAETNLAADGESITSMLMDSIQRETGVNMDEEMIDMISSQRAYQAAAKLFSTIDELMDLLVNGLKR